MCIIIIKQKGKTVSKEIAKTSARINPDGLGIIWLDTFEVTYHESSQYPILDTDRPFIAHFRYATVGAVSLENTHPFRCGNNENEWLMMNGTISGLGDKNVSDSRVLAKNLGDIPRHHWKKELEKYSCRFVTINVHSRTYQVYNKELWTQKEGVWYSKNIAETHLVAVYGTLKKGYNNYYSYLSTAKFIGSGSTKEKYPLIIRSLPYLIDKGGHGYNVDVDVFSVSDAKLKELDRLECHPNWYRRRKVDIKLNATTLSCWVYFNIKEDGDGYTYHKSYVQQTYKPSKIWDKYSGAELVDLYEKFSLKDKEVVEDDCEDCGFDVKNEKPYCVNCFHDLEHDAFSNYHCSSCNEWFSESEVLGVLF